MIVAKGTFCIFILCMGTCTGQTVYNWFAAKPQITTTTSSPISDNSISQSLSNPSNLYYYGPPEDSDTNKKGITEDSPDLTAFARITNSKKRIVTRRKIVKPSSDTDNLVFGQRISSSFSKTRMATTIRSIATRQIKSDVSQLIDKDLGTTPATIIAPEFDDDFVLQEPEEFNPGSDDEKPADLHNSNKPSTQVNEQENSITNSVDNAPPKLQQSFSPPTRDFQDQSQATATKQSFSQPIPKAPTQSTFSKPTEQTFSTPARNFPTQSQTKSSFSQQTAKPPTQPSFPRQTAAQTRPTYGTPTRTPTRTPTSQSFTTLRSLYKPPRVRIEYESPAAPEQGGPHRLLPKIVSQFSYQSENKQTIYGLPKIQSTKSTITYNSQKIQTIQPAGTESPLYKPSGVTIQYGVPAQNSDSATTQGKFSYPKTIYQYFQSKQTTPSPQTSYTNSKAVTTQAPATPAQNYGKSKVTTTLAPSARSASSSDQGKYTIPKTVHQYFQSIDTTQQPQGASYGKSKVTTTTQAPSAQSSSSSDQGKYTIPKTVHQYFQSIDTTQQPQGASYGKSKVTTTQAPSAQSSSSSNQGKYTIPKTVHQYFQSIDTTQQPQEASYGNSKVTTQAPVTVKSTNEKSVYQYFQSDNEDGNKQYTFESSKISTTQAPVISQEKTTDSPVPIQTTSKSVLVSYGNIGNSDADEVPSKSATTATAAPIQPQISTSQPQNYIQQEDEDTAHPNAPKETAQTSAQPEEDQNAYSGRQQKSQDYDLPLKQILSKQTDGSVPQEITTVTLYQLPTGKMAQKQTKYDSVAAVLAATSQTPGTIPPTKLYRDYGTIRQRINQIIPYDGPANEKPPPIANSQQQSNFQTYSQSNPGQIQPQQVSTSSQPTSSSIQPIQGYQVVTSQKPQQIAYPQAQELQQLGYQQQQSVYQQPSQQVYQRPPQQIQAATSQPSQQPNPAYQQPSQTHEQSPQPQISYQRPSRPNPTYQQPPQPQNTYPQPSQPNIIYQQPSQPRQTPPPTNQPPPQPQPTYQQPPQPQPTYQQPSQPQQTYQKPPQAQPAYQQPPQPQPVQPQPAYQRPSLPQSAYQQRPQPQPPQPQPAYQRSSLPQSAYQQPLQPQRPQPQPTYQQPPQPQPTYQQPPQPQPTYQRPSLPQSAYQQPPQPQPTYQQPPQPQPAYQQPTQPQPTYQQPSNPQPAYQRPSPPQPAYPQPQPTYQRPSPPQPTYQIPSVPQPINRIPQQLPPPNYSQPPQINYRPSQFQPITNQPSRQPPPLPQKTVQQSQPQVYQPQPSSPRPQSPTSSQSQNKNNEVISADSFHIVPAKLVFEEWSTFDQTETKPDPLKYSYNGVSR